MGKSEEGSVANQNWFGHRKEDSHSQRERKKNTYRTQGLGALQDELAG